MQTPSPYQTEIDEIIQAYREMRFAEKQRKRLNLAAQAYVRTLCGYSTHIDKELAAPKLKRAQTLIARDVPGDPLNIFAQRALRASDTSEATFIAIEREREREIKVIVRRLPIWTEWAADIVGLGEKSIGIIIGEAGDIGSYALNHPKGYTQARAVAALWKRMGVAVIDGIAQGKLPTSAAAETWIHHGYSRKRRAAMFTIGDAHIKVSASPYRVIYLRRKEEEQQRAIAQGLTILPAAKITVKRKATSISEGHIHRRAQRFMEQRLLRHLYKAWKRTMVVAVPEMAEAA